MYIDPGNEVFHMAVELVNQGNRNIFLTGKAGTGKTTFLKHIRENCPRQMAVVAPTGVAAINAGGVTIHSFFQLPFGPYIPDGNEHFSEDQAVSRSGLLSRMKVTSQKRDIFRQLELLIIDEVSMVRCDTLDAIDAVLRHFRKKPHEPFGGVQVLFIGDLYQLPPVIKDNEWRILSEQYDGPFFFDCHVMRNNLPLFIEFNKIYRQSEEKFINLLNQIRDNNLDDEGRMLLESRFDPQFARDKEEGYILLTTHNEIARSINAAELDKLSGESKNYKAKITGDFFESAYPAEELLQLKVGAQVMFIKNDSDRAKRYFNGKIGIVTKMNDDSITVTCREDGREIEVKPEEWLNIRYTVDKSSQKLEEETLGAFLQFPLRLAWAITIHKSQGLTFEKAIIDAGQSFAPGQVYVALSRCTSLDGLVLLSRIRENSLWTDSRIGRFSQLAISQSQLEVELATARFNAQRQLAISSFDVSEINHSFEEIRNYLVQNGDDFNSEALKWLSVLTLKLDDLRSTSSKFHSWIRSQLGTDVLPSENEELKERSIRAATYYIEQLDEILSLLKDPPIETDSTLHAKNFNELMADLFTVTVHMRYMLEGFGANYDLSAWYARRSAFRKPSYRVNVYAGERDSVNTEMAHPELFKRLKAMRDDLCRKRSQPVYMVASGASLKEMAAMLPVTESELLKVKGFGKAKVKQFGNDFLEIIRDYCEEHEIDPETFVAEPEEESTQKEKKRKKKGETQAESFSLFRSGLTVEEIAEHRNLKRTTIETHLAQYIETGELELDELVPDEKVERIKPVAMRSDLKTLTEIKRELGDEVSFGEIRMVIAWLRFRGENTREGLKV